jgi:DNA-binding transcriptional LysR family regulator
LATAGIARDRVPNLRHLRAFREVAHCHGVSAAAAREHLSQPAVTQAIAKLENALNVKLFERRRDGMFPTAIGAAYLARVESALGHLQAGAREAARLGLKQRGRGFADFDRLLTAAQLRALVAMSEADNFSRAARNIGISQPSIHRAARNLERLCGLRLFNGTQAGISLTPAANALVQRTKLAFSELQQAADEVNEYLGRDSTLITIGSLPLARTSILPVAIDAMVRSAPRVQIRVIDGPYDELITGLRHGDLDCIIGALRSPPPTDDVRQEVLFDDPLAVVVGRDHPLTRATRVTLADTLRYPWVAPPRTAPAGAMLYGTLRIHELPETPVRVVTSSLVVVRGLLALGEYITLISLHQMRYEYEQGAVVPLPIDLPVSNRPIGLTVRKDWRPTQTQQQFIASLRQASHTARISESQGLFAN